MVISVVIEGAWRQQSDLIEVGLHPAAIGHANDYTPEKPRDRDEAFNFAQEDDPVSNCLDQIISTRLSREASAGTNERPRHRIGS
jgi:hypothetical protein